jgi:hypothetical protein
MKRFYATLSLLTAFALGSQAQNTDVCAVAEIGIPANAGTGQKLCLGDHFSPSATPTGDSIHGIYGIEFLGPDGILLDDKVTMRTSFNNFLTQAECDAQVPPVPFADRYSWYSIYTMNATNVTNQAFFFSFDAVDSIGMLVDWARWQQYGPDSVRMYGPPHESFVNGQAYGFFVRSWGIGASATSIENTDDSMENNWAVVKIIWNDCATSIGELIAPKDKVSITAYPNPGSNEISVDYNFAKAENANIFIRDISGRTVATKKLGHIGVGEHTFSVDISALTPGMYMLELSGGELSGVAKFNKK